MKKNSIEVMEGISRAYKNYILELGTRAESQVYGIDIEEEALDILSCLGFNSEKVGTKYLAELIDCVYHERNGEYDDGYYNLDLYYNQHFLNMSEYYECGVKSLHSIIDDALIDINVADDISYSSLILSVVKNLIDIHSKDCKKSVDKAYVYISKC